MNGAGVMRKLLRLAIAVCAMAFVAVPAAEAAPVRTAQVIVDGTDIHYSAGMNMRLTGWGGSWTFVTGTWGTGTYSYSVGGSCLIPIATNVSYDPSTETLTFDCFAVALLTSNPGGPFGTESYSAWALGNIRVTANGNASMAGATVTALGNPFTIGFPLNPNGWNGIWGTPHNLVCMGPTTSCSMTVT